MQDLFLCPIKLTPQDSFLLQWLVPILWHDMV